MCQFCSEANERMEPTDDKLIGPSSEDHVGSSTSHAVISEQGTIEQGDFSSSEVFLARSAVSLRNINSFASNCSEYSVDVNPNDGHFSEQGGFESGQDGPSNGLLNDHLSKSNSVISINDIEQSDYLKDSHKEGKNEFRVGKLDLRSTSFKSTYDDDDISSSDESFDEANEELPTYDKDEIWVPPDAANKDNNTDDSLATIDDDDDECTDSDGTEWAKPSLLNGYEDGVSVSCRFKEEKQKAMEEIMDGKFKNLVRQLLKKVGVDNFDGHEGNWVDIVTHLAWKAALFIKPDATKAKAMDPAGYVKIKCIATGSPAESRLIKGLVFKKHAAHKHMATKYKNPRLLLIEGMLDQSSGSSGLSSFSSMISQDEDNLGVLVKNLEMCHPNVILVEKSASRDVVERVLKLGVTLVLDMKLNRLERVARCTGSLILSSNSTFNQDLSHCDSVYFEKFVEDHATVGEGGKKPSKTLMFLEGCPKRLGCTILLKGSHCEELKKIKGVVQCAVVMAYHFILETSFLVDQQAMFSTFAYRTEAGILLADEHLTSIVFESPHTPNIEEHIHADEVRVLIADGDDGGSSHVQECTANAASSHILDIPISNGFHEEGSILVKEKTAKATETVTCKGFHCNITDNVVVDDTSTGSNETFMGAVLRAQPSISDAPEKVSAVSSGTFRQLSAYVDLNERQSDAETAAYIPVSPSEEAPEGSNTEAKGSSLDKPLHNDPQPPSSLSAAAEDAAKAVDGEDSLRSMDEISSVLDCESILVLKSSRNASKGTICEQSHFSHIKFYRNFDVPLEKFLLENLFSQSDRCERCREPPEAHFYYYAHHSKQLTIRVKQLGKESPLPGKSEGKLWMWSRCGKCKPNQKVETKRVLISTAARGLSFGKFLELSFSSHSSFNKLSNCGHSFQKDFLYFFGLGSMVAMFQYSRVVRYKVSVPAQKLEFSSSINTDWLQNEIESVYTKGLLLFTEISKYLKEIESGFSGSNHLRNGSSEGFSDIVALLKLERSEFEENIKDISIKNENSHNSVHKLLSLNQLRWEILLEARIWNKRLRFLQFLLASSSNGGAQRQIDLEENGDAGGRAEGSDTAAEKAMQEQMVLKNQKVEGTEEDADKAMQGPKHLEEDHSEETVVAADETVKGWTGVDDNSGVEVERVQSTADTCLDNSMIEHLESVSRRDHSTSENCWDGEVQIERVTGADNPSQKDLPIHESREQVLSLPRAEDVIQGSTPVDSAPSLSSLQESLGSPNPPSTLKSSGESHQTNDTSLSGDVFEGRNIPLVVNKEYPGCAESYVFERLASIPSPNSEDNTGWIWHPLAKVREKCMRDLRKETVTDFLPTISQVVNEEGSRLHIPVDDGRYVVSDYDGEISSCVACALAMIKDQSPPASDSDENVSLKRAVSEPSPNMSLKSYDSDVFHSVPSMPWTGSRFPSFDGLNRLDSMVDYGLIHPEVTLGIDKYSMKSKYSVVIMYADTFRALRERCCPSELDYIASLSRCKVWDAKGGKSKSFFAKTLDDRLIIKEIKKIEFESFMKFAPNYFSHINQSYEFGNQTCLAKILGIYQVTTRHAKTGKETKHDLMVQENLSFGRNVTRQYDLKGALHARFTATSDGAGDVLLDQNFVNDMNSSPLYIGQRAKRLLQRAIWNDTTFLNSINVMDYSLLVGVDRQRKELVCGIIDYLRQYTWDKQFETWVKASLVVPKNVLPTVISPGEYKKRFRKFMDTHFLTVPDHWCSQRSSNPCRLCGVKAADDSSFVKSLDKQEEEPNGSSAHL